MSRLASNVAIRSIGNIRNNTKDGDEFASKP